MQYLYYTGNVILELGKYLFGVFKYCEAYIIQNV